MFVIILKILKLRFFKSLGKGNAAAAARFPLESGQNQPERDAAASDRSPLETGQGERRRVFLESSQFDGDERGSIVHFSLESLLEFKNDNLEHTIHHAASSPQPRKRPNYDNRKRKFMANQPSERKTLL